MKKSFNIPLSMPNRVIIEPNQPRQGYSHLTWNTLNEYYLQKCMTKQQYADFCYECKKIAFKVYSENREENKMLTETPLMKASNFVWSFCMFTIIALFISELDEKLSEWCTIPLQVLFTICIFLIFVMSIANFFQQPPKNIFINYEKFFR